MSTTERRAVEVGQVWEYLPTANLGCERRTIALIDGVLHPVDESGINCCDDLEWFVRNARLLAPAPPAKPACGAPEGYKECNQKCGRFHGVKFDRCWACHFEYMPSARAICAEKAAEYPDWTPPLESKPAETGKCSCGAFGGGSHVRVLQCDNWSQRKAPPAQEAPKPCGKCGGTTGVRNVPFEQGLLKLCGPCHGALNDWSHMQSGTPYAGPERLPVRPMSFQPFDDDFAGDVR